MEQGTNSPVYGANVVVIGSDPILGISTDVDGYFSISGVPVGRVNLKISAVGYEDVYLLSLTLLAGKELQVQIEMRVDIKTLNEVVIRATEDRYSTNNETVSVSGRAPNLPVGLPVQGMIRR